MIEFQEMGIKQISINNYWTGTNLVLFNQTENTGSVLQLSTKKSAIHLGRILSV